LILDPEGNKIELSLIDSALNKKFIYLFIENVQIISNSWKMMKHVTQPTTSSRKIIKNWYGFIVVVGSFIFINSFRICTTEG
jgi:hypothetical protein